MSEGGGSRSSGCSVSDAPLIAVLDYGIGNLRSAQKGFERAGADARLTTDHGLIADADGVVLPGVGHFSTCMAQLRASGLFDVTLAAIRSEQPFLGICVGMQMLFEGSEEAPGVSGLGVFPGTSRLIPAGLPRPQMQWNRLDVRRSTELLDGLGSDIWMYFVHSYAADTDDRHITATCDYVADLTAMVDSAALDGAPRVWATQFHPEKSGDMGRAFTTNFMQQVRLAQGVTQ